MPPLGTTKIMQPTRRKKPTQPLGTNKNHGTSREKKKHATSLNFLSGHFEFVTVYLGLVLSGNGEQARIVSLVKNASCFKINK